MQIFQKARLFLRIVTQKIKSVIGYRKTFTITIQLAGQPKIPVKDLYRPSDTSGIHKKPSTPYGYYRNGNEEVSLRLPEESGELETAVMEKFVALYNHNGGNITDLRKLPESDHDFELHIDGLPVVVQLTESSLRDIGYKWGAGFQYDQRAYSLLCKAIRRKAKKQYSKPSEKEFWLVVWQNDVSVGAEPESNRQAFNYLLNYQQPFDRIYYFWFYSDEPKGIIKEVWRSGNVWSSEWLKDNEPLDEAL